MFEKFSPDVEKPPKEDKEDLKVGLELNDEGEVLSAVVKRGNYTTKKELIDELENEGYDVNEYAKDVISQEEFELAENQEKVELVVKDVAAVLSETGIAGKLTAGEPKTIQEVFEAVRKSDDLDLVPPEIAVALRLLHENQPEGEDLYVGHEPIEDSDGEPHLLRLYRHEDNQILDARFGHSNMMQAPTTRFVFKRNK